MIVSSAGEDRLLFDCFYNEPEKIGLERQLILAVGGGIRAAVIKRTRYHSI